MAPASTGNDNSSKIAVTSTDQGKRAMRSSTTPKTRKFLIVVIKFTAPNKEEIPAKCNEKIVRSTDAPLCPRLLLKGG